MLGDPNKDKAQSAGAVEYADCIFASRPNECSGYYTEPSDGEALGLELKGMWSTPSLPLLPGLL